MIPRYVLLASFCIGRICSGQEKTPALPESIVIGEHSFIDFGPPTDFYELVRISPSTEGVFVERTLITPEGQACIQPATVETRTATLHKSLSELLEHENPCSIPKKDLNRELKRRKKYLVFSGSNVVMEASCGGEPRRIKMDILDRDMFDSRANTPEHTSWTMGVINEIDNSTGPSQWDKPIFPTGKEIPAVAAQETDTIRALREGKYDYLFGKNQLVSQVVVEAEEPRPPPPSVELVSATPEKPIDPVLQMFPPIARLVHVEGIVTVKFDINQTGIPKNVIATDGHKMLQAAAVDAVMKWKYPQTAFGQHGEAQLQFKQNCEPKIRTNVN
jgi:hypothetical protein